MRFLSTLSFVSATILCSLVQAGPEYKIQSDFYYNYVERISYGTEAGLEAAVKTFYEEMVEVHKEYIKDGYPQPMMAAGMVVGGDYWLATSGSYVKGGSKEKDAYPPYFPKVLRTALDECFQEFSKHKKNSNCAEMRLLALYFEETREESLPAGTPLAVYGKGGESQMIQFHHPCSTDIYGSGCKSVVVSQFKMKVLTRRTISARKSKDKPIKSGRAVPKKSKGAKKTSTKTSGKKISSKKTFGKIGSGKAKRTFIRG